MFPPIEHKRAKTPEIEEDRDEEMERRGEEHPGPPPQYGNPKSREYGADGEWNPSIGRKHRAIEAMKEKICGATPYVCIRRDGEPEEELEIERGTFRGGRLAYFGAKKKGSRRYLVIRYGGLTFGSLVFRSGRDTGKSPFHVAFRNV